MVALILDGVIVNVGKLVGSASDGMVGCWVKTDGRAIGCDEDWTCGEGRLVGCILG